MSSAVMRKFKWTPVYKETVGGKDGYTYARQ
jgi:hypothetical protein